MATDLRPLAWSRVAIGALLLLRTTPLLSPFDIWFLRDTWPLLGWPTSGWDSVSGSIALPAAAVEVLCIVRTVAALLFMLGVFARVSGICAGAAGYLVLAQNPFGFIFTLHLFYQAAILLALADSACVFALHPEPPRSPRSSYLLIHTFASSIYLWAGLHKLRPDWLDGRTIALFQEHAAIHGLIANLLLATPTERMLAATGVALFEIAIGPLLLWRRTRRPATTAALVFHAGLELTAHPDLLGWGMASLLITFIEPRAPPSV